MWDESDEYAPSCGNSDGNRLSYTYSKAGRRVIAIGWHLCGVPTSQPRVHPTKSNIVDHGGDVVDGRIDGHENSWRARRTKAGVNAMVGGGGCY